MNYVFQSVFTNTIKYNRYVKSTAIYISEGKFNGPFR